MLLLRPVLAIDAAALPLALYARLRPFGKLPEAAKPKVVYLQPQPDKENEDDDNRGKD